MLRFVILLRACGRAITSRDHKLVVSMVINLVRAEEGHFCINCVTKTVPRGALQNLKLKKNLGSVWYNSTLLVEYLFWIGLHKKLFRTRFHSTDA
jgi:hypothetical protein